MAGAHPIRWLTAVRAVLSSAHFTAGACEECRLRAASPTHRARATRAHAALSLLELRARAARPGVGGDSHARAPRARATVPTLDAPQALSTIIIATTFYFWIARRFDSLTLANLVEMAKSSEGAAAVMEAMQHGSSGNGGAHYASRDLV